MEWKTVKISDIAYIINGGTPKTSIPEYWDGDIPWLSVKDFNTGLKYVSSAEKHITQEGLEHSATNLLEPEDIIISARGTIGVIAMLSRPMAFNQSCFGLRARNFDAHYLYYLLKEKVKELQGQSQGSVFDTIVRATFDRIECVIPATMDDQHQRSAILSSLDDKIENNNRINANLEAQVLTIYNSWFGEESEEVKLSDICLNITDGVHNTVIDDKDGEYLLLSCKNIVGGKLNIDKGERRINRETFDKLRKRTKLAKGDILVSTVGTVGEIVMLLEEPINIEFQRSVGLIKPDTTKATSTYIYCALKCKQSALKHVAHGAVQQCIFIGDLKDFEIPYSSIDKIKQFDVIASPIFGQIASNQRENQRLAKLRDTLLPKLMKGEIAL